MNIDIIVDKTQNLLDIATEYFSKINGCSKYLPEIDRLKRKLWQPCVLAVGGKVKAGKSSFINALLGKKLAKVGELETTATINMFRHINYAGAGYSEEKPVKVVWNNGFETWENTSFMDSLQGNDDVTLKKAEGISHLEFYVDDDLLKKLTFVDTPGTDAVVGDGGQAHQKVSDRFFRLRQKHSEQTNTQIDEADAIIYLVGAVAGANQKQFLFDFQNVTSGASAINALGVLSKVDIDESLLSRRHEQAEYVANSLKDALYTVIPVSAGINDAIANNKDKLFVLQQWLKRMPQTAFNLFMRSDRFFFTEDANYLNTVYQNTTQTPPSVEERRSMKGDMQWALFRAIARELYSSDNLESAIKNLKEIANIETVRQTIYNRFFNRSKIIRCNRILKDLQIIALRIKQSTFNELRSNRADYDEWLSIISAGESLSTKNAAETLRHFIATQLPSICEIDKIESKFLEDLILPIEDLRQELDDVDIGYQHIAALQSRRNLWPEEEYDELCQIMGLFGKKDLPGTYSDALERQSYWQNKSVRLRDRRDQAIAEYAVECYERLIRNQ